MTNMVSHGEGEPEQRNPSSDMSRMESSKSIMKPKLALSMSFDNLYTSPSGALRPGVPKRSLPTSIRLEDYIRSLGGDRPVYSVLVANNGLAAVKFIRSIRSWSYKTLGDERSVNVIAMASPEDMKADAEHIRCADQFIEVPGGRNVNNYANVQLIASIAVRAGVDAVWPGWGHASEKPELPELLKETANGAIRFIGPPAQAMAALGDKIGSTILAQSAHVPTLPWSGDGVTVEYQDCPNGEIPEEIYDKACIHSLSEALECCNRIGYPVMLKASWGGGGKGIRKVMSDEDVRLVFRQVQGEVPGSPIFAMKLAPQSRHLEVQLLCDMYGNVCSLFSRDCSVQRRHQKIVEEGPVTAASSAVLEHMESCARALARSVGYVGAATVEYLYTLETGEYCFLELNPRLQVEHPVTEWISGVNIPACQLLISQGVPLHAIPDLRRLFGKEVNGKDEINFEDTSCRMKPSGHVIAVRVTAENANDGFKPTAGSVDEISFRSTPEVWGYFSVKGGGEIHEYSDSQFGHLFAKGETRDAAIRSMVVALKELRVRGEIRTNSDYVCDLIQTEDFQNDVHHTGWLDARIAAQITSGSPPWHLSVVCGAALRALDRVNGRLADYLGHLQRGQLPSSRISLVSTNEEFVVDGVKYNIDVARTGPQTLSLTLNGSTIDIVARKLPDGGLLIQMDGESHVVHAEEEATGTRLSINNQTCLLSNEHDPSSLTALSTGKLISYLVEDGCHVEADKPYAEIEVMKMVMTLLTPASGIIHQILPEGSVLIPGNLIARLDLDDPASIKRAEPCQYKWPEEIGPPVVVPEGTGHRFAAAKEAALNILAGYRNDVSSVVSSLLEALDNPALGLHQWTEDYGIVASRLPSNLAGILESIAEDCAKDLETARNAQKSNAEMGIIVSFCFGQMLETINDALNQASPEDRAGLEALLESLRQVARAHADGMESYARSVAVEILEAYLTVEEKFESGGMATEQEIIDDLRQAHPSSLESVVDIVLSRNGLPLKKAVILKILGALVSPNPDVYRPQLRRLAALAEPVHADVAARAQQLLEHSLLGELRSLVARALSGLDMFVESQERALFDLSPLNTDTAGDGISAKSVGRRPTVMEGLYAGLGNLTTPSMQSSSIEARMNMLVEAPAAVEDALASLLDDPDATVRQRALLTYIRRIYHPFLLHEPKFSDSTNGAAVAVWAYEDAVFSGTPFARECFGAAMMVPNLASVPQALENIRVAAASTGLVNLNKGTLHVVMVNQGPESIVVTDDAYVLLKNDDIHVDGYAPSECEDSHESTVDPKRMASAALAQMTACRNSLQESGFESVSVLSKRGHLSPLRTVLYLSKETGQYNLEPVMSLVEPPTASALELQKMISFPDAIYSTSRNRQWHIYSVNERKNSQSAALTRVFLRGVIRQLGRPDLLAATYTNNAAAVATSAMQEVENTLLGAVTEIERLRNVAALRSKGRSGPDWSHIYLDVLSSLPLGTPSDESLVAAALRNSAGSVTARASAALRRAAVAQWEVKLRIPSSAGAWRIVVSVPSGHEGGEDCVDIYRESFLDSGDSKQRNTDSIIYRSVTQHSDIGKAPLDGISVMKPYAPLALLQQKRLAARRHNTTYCYDFPAVFENALREIWAARAAAGEPGAVPPSGRLVEAEELVPAPDAVLCFKDRTPLITVNRPISNNNVGIVAWVLTLRTPECPQGRRIVAVANDITFASGSFGPAEDAMFRAATEHALAERLPLIYLAANSGARVGLANELKQCINAAWNDESDPSKGFKYLYLTPEDYHSIMNATKHSDEGSEASIKASKAIMDNGEERWILSDVIGREDGLGVECLSGSGSIAGIYTRAFREGFTITLVSGRTVGIGAYLARLGRRCIQRKDQPIILTGYAALNKLLGRDVYTSHMQLGGPRVMGYNGVSHHIVDDDLEGAKAILQWLSYTAARIGDAPPRLQTADPENRKVEYMVPVGGKLDPRAAIAGSVEDGGVWKGGLFDRGSWMEAQEGWARTVVTGRARLAGIPVGVIGVEVSTIMLNLPADPGLPDSSERVIPQAGQVWFPDSALKTAQAMEEFNLEGLPLFILANWRGFSGGQRDLFEGVLQAGSLIVDNLRTYDQPVIMYIPPGCELRGGAWVVIDSQINAERIESYADPTAQGGVLEPEGVVEIKFRAPELRKLMHRLDPVLKNLANSGEEGVERKIKERESALMPIYHQIALSFAQMHDKSARMLSKGVLRGIVPWETSREIFACRLRRRLAEDALIRHISAANPGGVSREEARDLLRSWFLSSPMPAGTVKNCCHSGADFELSNELASDSDSKLWHNDAAFMSWAESSSGAARIAMELKILRQNAAAATVRELSATAEGTDGLVRGLYDALEANPSLLLQLRSLVSSAEAALSGGTKIQ